MIDIIVPVYRGLEETAACLNSVWHSRCQQPWRLIVINDASPEPELTAWLRDQQQLHSMLLIENPENLGFVASVNEGMRQSSSHDVVLLNSDTEVANDWLDRLAWTAQAAPDIATVTPFSNNATICSYPGFCLDNALPTGWDVSALDSLFARVNGQKFLDIPTAVGFCMYIRRAVLDRIGLFDVEHFGKGYGEENDFCCRALAAGYRNLLAADVFVWHKGNVSFGDSHNPRKQSAGLVLDQLHPSYTGRVQAHILADPARELRLAVDIRRWRQSSQAKVLFITHDRGGGTEQYCRQLADLLHEQALFFRLAPEPGGQVCLSAYSRGEKAGFYFSLPQDYAAMLNLLRAIGISQIHFQHLLSLPPVIFDLSRDLGLDYDFTAHDYYSICPQISLTDEHNRYCGERGEEACNACLRDRPVGAENIQQWRARFAPLLAGARNVYCPAPSVARRLQQVLKLQNTRLVEHPDALAGWRGQVVSANPQGSALKVAVLGALSPIKGADLLEDAAEDAIRRRLPLRFKLFGYAYRDLKTSSHLQVSGPYVEADLPQMLAQWHPHLVWFPNQAPETYSYTLSSCFQLGLPVMVGDLGAQQDRIQGRPNSWSHDWSAGAPAWNDRLLEVARACPEGAINYQQQASSADHYLNDYLQANSARLSDDYPVPTLDTLYKTRAQSLSGLQRGKISLLGMLIWLKANPAMAWLVRRIPMSVQRQIKSLLLGHPRN